MAYIGSRPDNVISRNAQNEYNYTATGGQTTFTGADSNNNTLSYTPGNIEVYFNGARLEESDFTATNGTSIVLANAAVVNDELSIVAVNVFAVADVVPASTGGTFQGGIAVQGGVNVAGHILPDTNITYDLGSTTQRFRDLYLSGNSIKLGTRTISQDNIPDVNLSIAPEVLTIDVAAPAAGQDTQWLWNWLTSSLPYARREITNSNELNVPLYKQGTYTVNNFAKTQYGSMTQAHTMYFKWIDGAGTQNNISWVTDQGTFTDSHPDINGGSDTTVQRLSISVPSTITPPTLTAPSVTYTVTNSGSGSYTFSGPRDGNNPNIGPLRRGGTYTFNISATGHPFYLTTDNGTNFSAGTYFGEYTSGVTGSRTDSGTLTFVVPANAPDTLYYQCGNHSSMRGAITVKDLAVETNINGNYVVYAQHTQEGHKTPVELRPIPSLVNQMCLVYDSSVNKFVPQDLATYVENTPSFENKIREVAGTAELVVEDGSAVVAKVNVYADSTYLPLTDNNAGDQAFATDTNKLYIWDGSAWQLAGAANTGELPEGTNLYYTDARVDARLASGSVGNIVTTGYLAGPATFTIDPAGVGDNTGTVLIAGNLQVDGTTTTINSTTVEIDDLNLTLASGAADANAANGAGITVDGANATFIYESAVDEFSFNKGIRAVDYSVSDGTKVIDSSKRGYFVNLQNSNPISFLTGTNGVSGSGAQGINVRHVYAGTSYANSTAGAGDIEASANFKMAGNVVVDSSRNISGSTVSASTKFSTTGSNNEPILMATSGSFVRPKIRTASYSGTPETSLQFNQQSGASTSRNYYMGIYSVNNANPYFYFDNRTSGPTHFQTNGSTRLSITGGGNVGIGEPDPDEKLHIKNSTGSYIKHEGPSSGDYATGYQIFEGSTASAAFYTNPSHDLTILSKDGITFRLDNANRIKFTSTGNVGIGTTVPAAKLHVNTGSGTNQTNTLGIERTGVNDYSGISFRTGAIVDWSIGHNSNGGFTIYENGNDSETRFIVKDGGNVGIGTNSPAAKTHIHGTGDLLRLTSTNSGNGGAQMDLIHQTSSPADGDYNAMINMGGNYSGGNSAYATSMRSVWSDAGGRQGRLEFYTRNAGDFTKKFQIEHDGDVYQWRLNNWEPILASTASSPDIVYTSSQSFDITPTNDAYVGVRTNSSKYKYFRLEADLRSDGANHYGFFWGADQANLGYSNGNQGHKWVYRNNSNRPEFRGISSNGTIKTMNAVSHAFDDGVFHRWVLEVLPSGVTLYADGVLVDYLPSSYAIQGFCGIHTYNNGQSLLCRNVVITSLDSVQQEAVHYSTHSLAGAADGIYKMVNTQGMMQEVYVSNGWMLIAANDARDALFPNGNSRRDLQYTVNRNGAQGHIGEPSPDNDYIIGGFIDDFSFSKIKVEAWGWSSTNSTYNYANQGDNASAEWSASSLTTVVPRSSVTIGGNFGIYTSAAYFLGDGIRKDYETGGFSANSNQTTIGGVGVNGSSGDPTTGCYLGHGTSETGSYSEGWYRASGSAADCQGYATWVKS